MKKRFLAMLLTCAVLLSFSVPLTLPAAADGNECRENAAMSDALQILRRLVKLTPATPSPCLALTKPGPPPEFYMSDALQVLRKLVKLSHDSLKQPCPRLSPECPNYDVNNHSSTGQASTNNPTGGSGTTPTGDTPTAVGTVNVEQITIRRDLPTASTNVTGTAVGEITLNTTALPAWLTAAVVGGQVVVSLNNAAAPADGEFKVYEIHVWRGGVRASLFVTSTLSGQDGSTKGGTPDTATPPTGVPTLPPTTPPPTNSGTPTTGGTPDTSNPGKTFKSDDVITITDRTNPTGSTMVSGTATGEITVTANGLPSWLEIVINQATNVITVRLAPNATVPDTPVAQVCNLTLSRENVSAPLTVSVSLGGKDDPNISATPVTITRANANATSTVTGSADAITELNRTNIPAWLLITAVGGSEIQVSLASVGVPVDAVSQIFTATFQKGSVTGQLTITVNLTGDIATGLPTTGTETPPTTNTTDENTPTETSDSPTDTTPPPTTTGAPPDTPAPPTTTEQIVVPMPAGVVYDMQLDGDFDRFTGSNSGTLGHLFLRVGDSSGTLKMTGSGTAPNRQILIEGRGGTSQGLRMRPNEIDITPRVGHQYTVEITGSVANGSNLRLRQEKPEQVAIATGTATSVSATVSAASITGEGIEWSIGNSSGNSDMTITGMKITRVCPTGCTMCAEYTTTITGGGTGSSATPASAISGQTVTLRAGTRTGFLFDGWTVTSGGVTLDVANSANASFVMGTANVAVTANWKEHKGGLSPQYSAADAMAKMKVGWNYGNALDCYNGNREAPATGYSNPWSNPRVANYGALTVSQMETNWMGGSNYAAKPDLFKNVKGAGFDTIRIPITWYKAIRAPGALTTTPTTATLDGNFIIHPDYLKRVKEIVTWAHEEGFTVIINSHHDDFIMPFNNASDMAKTEATIKKLWTIIANEFKDFDERLIFEVLNEPRQVGSTQEWGAGGSGAAGLENRQRVNRMNQAAVDAIRATGGDNQNRILMIPTYAASTHTYSAQNAFDGYVKPSDPLNPGVNKFIMSVHAYVPTNFTGVLGVGTTYNVADIVTMMDGVKSAADKLGMPVVIGEYGAVARAESSTDPAETVRVNWTKDYVSNARSRGMVPVWWDTGIREGGIGVTEGRFGLFNRHNTQAFSAGGVSTPAFGNRYPNITNAIMQGAGVVLGATYEVPSPLGGSTGAWVPMSHELSAAA
ncbi:MAG: cellulase family glycosylhydrolase [Oscillospiraceae bacterium]|nr:cellulase family glycosylhydrolase [Oscillospiraceae bacterium]